MIHSDLQLALGDLLEVDTDRYPNTVRTRHLNAAIRGLELDLEGPWTKDIGSLSITAGTPTYDPRSDLAGADLLFSQPELVFFTGSSGIVELELLFWSDFTAAYRLQAADAGVPRYYAMRGRNLWVGPTPSEDLTLTIDFMGVYEALSAGGDTNLWTEEATDLVLADAARRACPWLLEEQRTPVFDSQVQEESTRLLHHWSHELSRNRVMEAEEV